jgi:[glutamine synthetase] adenylyltransferase / [glutamine synthetase]-adenylyl-L-tyrosine phosphorylase
VDLVSITLAFARAQANSPFLALLIEQQPGLVALIQTGDFDAALSSALATQVENNPGATLRKQRQGVALVTAIADLSGAWDLTRVTRVLSDFADSALDTAIAAAFAERVPGAEVRGFAVIALGKHGGQELNYSSDIDPIFLFDPAILPHRDNEDAQTSAVRIGRRVIELLSARDENGYVFRVDMRLRPSPEVSSVTLSVNAAISYYESSALAWEQAAFIRSRAAAGDRALGQYFLDNIQNFIWRRSMDFGQLHNIQAMSLQIRDHFSKGQILGPGFDLKRGRGGIRECEFFAQAHQLIHGGRNPALRMADTVCALSALAQANAITATDAEAITQAYRMLRTIEHRLQMVDDRQTHSLPDNEDALCQVAALYGLASAEALIETLSGHVDAVRAIYDQLAGDDGATPRLADDGLPLEDQLAAFGFDDIVDISQRLKRWRSGKLRAIRSASAQDAFEAILPQILTALAQAPDPARALARFDNLIEALPSAINFFRLLEARPGLLQLLADILSYAPALAEAMGRRIEYLDGLIDGVDEVGDGSARMIQERIEAAGPRDNFEAMLNHVRAFVGEMRFRLGVQLIEGQRDPLAVAHDYAALAEAALRTLAQATIAEFEQAHGRVPDSELVILALGRLGGESLTHASDLDLILLFTGDFRRESDGRRPLPATQYFNRLVQRIIAALTVPTATGALYEVDTRLRPSGAKGLLCASVASFAKYQSESAWVWEHMALTRARLVFGSDGAKAELDGILEQVLGAPRDTGALHADILEMRLEMASHKPPKGPLDVKAMPGGLVDIEFIVHAQQLVHKHGLYPQLPNAIAALVEHGDVSQAFASAHDFFARLLIIIRLVAPDCQMPASPACALIARCLDCDDWQMVENALETNRSIVLDHWRTVFGEERIETIKTVKG